MKIARISLVAAAVLLGGRLLWADWPPSSSTREGPRTTRTQKNGEPSAFSKLTEGPRNFFANLFGAKKAAPKKRLVHPYASSYARKPKETKKESPLTSWLKPKEPPPPKSTNEWMQLPPIRP